MIKSAEEIARECAEKIRIKRHTDSPMEFTYFAQDIIAAAIRDDRAEPVSDREVTAVRDALRNSFMSQVSTGAGKLFGETGVAVPLETIWDTYARAALDAARQARANADEKGGAR